MIRVLLVDDHRLVREALCSMLDEEADISVVGQTGDGASALRLCGELKPDVVLMDIALPDISGIDATRLLAAEIPQVRVLALSTHIDRRIVERMLEAGAIGYIHKGVGRDEVLQGVRAVASGTSYLSQNIAALLVRNQESHDHASEPLTKRETQVLTLVASGKTSAQIAKQLYIAISTVDAHRYNIMSKLDVHNVAELTQYAIREGLVSP